MAISSKHTAQVRTFDRPDKTVTASKARHDFIEMCDKTVLRCTLEPGWDERKDVESKGAGGLCDMHHLGYVVSGRLEAVQGGGERLTLGAGSLVDLPPGHSARVLGNEQAVIVDFSGGAGKVAVFD